MEVSEWRHGEARAIEGQFYYFGFLRGEAQGHVGKHSIHWELKHEQRETSGQSLYWAFQGEAGRVGRKV